MKNLFNSVSRDLLGKCVIIFREKQNIAKYWMSQKDLEVLLFDLI